jgi:hypothetical protein
MGEHILKIAIAELSSVRIQCRNCSLVLEVPRDGLDSVPVKCPGCQEDFVLPNENQKANVKFMHLKQILEELQGMDIIFGVEFPVKLPSDNG